MTKLEKAIRQEKITGRPVVFYMCERWNKNSLGCKKSGQAIVKNGKVIDYLNPCTKEYKKYNADWLLSIKEIRELEKYGMVKYKVQINEIVDVHKILSD